MNCKNAKRLLSLLLCISLLLSMGMTSTAAVESTAQNASISQMKVNARTDPMNLDDEDPVFGWTMDSNVIGQKQTAYQILVTDDKNEIVWDSGKVFSSASQNISYQGDSLQPKTTYQWTVKVWDRDGNVLASQPAHFGTALMDSSIEAWDGAQWIGSNTLNLDADTLPVYQIDYTMQLGEGSTKAGFVYGANDPRLNDYTKNNYLIEGENYVYVEFDASGLFDDDDTTPAMINIYRKGYCTEDMNQPDNTTLLHQLPLNNRTEVVDGQEFEIRNDLGLTADNVYEPMDFHMYCTGNVLNISVNGTDIQHVGMITTGRVTELGVGTQLLINPQTDVIRAPTYPRLNDIGFATGEDSAATFRNVSVKHYNAPEAEIFGEHTGATYAIFEGLDGVEVNGSDIVVAENTLSYADPSFGSTPMLRREFDAHQEIASAKVYVTARGVYELYLNGERVGDDWFNPGYSQYDATLNYTVYDVTEMIQSGTNAIGAYLGSGWWSDQITPYLYNCNFNGDRPSLLLKMEITYEDGSVEQLVSDESWKAFTDGPIRYAGFFNGEKYDANLEAGIEGWDQAGYDDQNWKSAEIVEALDWCANPELTAKIDEPVREVETLSVIDHFNKDASNPHYSQPKAGEDVYIYDMGVNMVGVPEIKLPELPAGTKITFRYAEMLYPELEEDNPYYYGDLAGMILTENLRGAYATDVYICKGTPGGETYRPRFTFHGYRYIEVSGVGGVLPQDAIKGIVLSSITEPTVSYNSSNELTNQLYLNIMRSLYGNHVSIPTDCPQRDERQGWTGDAAVFCRTASYFGDMNAFYQQWGVSLRDTQDKGTGSYGMYAPVDNQNPASEDNYDPSKIDSSVCWPAGGILPVWETYQQYGELDFIREHFESMTKYLDGVLGDHNLSEGCQYLINGGGLADHLCVEETDSNYCQNIVAKYLLDCVSTMARAIGEDEVAERYADRAAHMKAEFNEKCIDPETGKSRSVQGVLQDTQSSYALAIQYDMVEEENLPLFVEHYAAACKRGNGTDEYTITTGFYGTGKVLPSLTTSGKIDEAYAMFEQTKYASWLYPITQGATSIWERWNAYTVENGFGGNNGMNSFNHYSAGAVGEWMVNYHIGIINDEEQPGFQHFILQPTPGGSFTFVDGSYDSYYGEIISNWTAEDGNMTFYHAVVPANTSATLYLPVEAADVIVHTNGAQYIGDDIHNGQICAKFELTSGGYDFTVENGAITVDVAEGYVDDNASVQSVSAPESAQVNENFVVTVVTGSDITDVRLYNENDMAIGRKGIDIVSNENGTKTWSITVSLGTVGDNRLIRVMTKNASGILTDSGMSASVDITSVPASLLSFDLPESAVANRTFVVQATTDLTATKIEVYNETGMKMGIQSLSSKIVDGQKVWIGVMSIGTQGERTFSAYAVNKYGARGEALSDHISVKAFA